MEEESEGLFRIQNEFRRKVGRNLGMLKMQLITPQTRRNSAGRA